MAESQNQSQEGVSREDLIYLLMNTLEAENESSFRNNLDKLKEYISKGFFTKKDIEDAIFEAMGTYSKYKDIALIALVIGLSLFILAILILFLAKSFISSYILGFISVFPIVVGVSFFSMVKRAEKNLKRLKAELLDNTSESTQN
jgi:uncharacterized membrane protein